ncbi:MAG: dihydroorotate dehydrogenase electron transfer subunit [Thermodesulfovibrionales bacterium]
MSKSFKAEIIENREVARNIHLIKILSLSPLMNPEPGQFYMLGVAQNYDPLLKRPFCVFDSESQEILFLIKSVGKGTSMLNLKLAGSKIDVIGPLGRPYPVVDKSLLIVAGGMGIASVFSLIKRLSGKAKLLYGAGSMDQLVLVDEIKTLIPDAVVVTDDGSAGKRGTVIDHLDEIIQSMGDVSVYSCGPEIMLKKISEYCNKKDMECYISLEQNMACGIGSCLGCVVKTKHGYQRVCKEGAVFSAKEIIWE